MSTTEGVAVASAERGGAEAASAARGPFGMLIGMIVKPRATMAALREARRRWWIVPAILMVGALIFSGFAYSRANAEFLYQQQVEMFEQMPPEQRGPMAEPPAKATPPLLTTGLRIAGQVVGVIVTWVVWAGLLALASTFFGQNGARFGGFFAMVVWAWLPHAVRHLVQGVYQFVTQTPIYNQGLSGLVLDNTPMAFSPFSGPRYVPPTRSDQVWAAFLGRIDVYRVWSLLLLVTGVIIFARASKKRAWLLTLGIWLIATLLSLLPTIIGLTSGLRLF
ncbi:MAG: YIP1 family protein [Anaerolineae bacterium]